jgi:hypothetical protein
LKETGGNLEGHLAAAEGSGRLEYGSKYMLYILLLIKKVVIRGISGACERERPLCLTHAQKRAVQTWLHNKYK